MQPFKIRVDWLCWRHEQGPVEVELHVLTPQWTETVKTLRTFDTPAEAIAWAVQWFRGRGLNFLCDVERHAAQDDPYVVLHATSGMYIGTGQPEWLDETTGVIRTWP